MTKRYEPSRRLPPYTYIPGRTPHPKSDPRGHAYGVAEAQLQPFECSRLESSPDFRHAVDLFNLGYYWEAHEVWELLWHAVGRSGAWGSALKGLIKLAAAGVKCLEGNAAGVASHLARAADLLDEAAAAGATTIGTLDLSELAAAIRLFDVSVVVGVSRDNSAPRPVWSAQLDLNRFPQT